jgi:hypothetical protein
VNNPFEAAILILQGHVRALAWNAEVGTDYAQELLSREHQLQAAIRVLEAAGKRVIRDLLAALPDAPKEEK